MSKLTKAEAGKFLFKYQNLYNPRQLATDEEIISFIRKIGCIQYDPLNKIARNAELVLQSRCRDFSEKTLYNLLYEKRALLDGWDKNMSLWCVQDWPFFARKREDFRKQYAERVHEFKAVKNMILTQLQEKSFLTAKELNGSTKVAWSWAPADIGRAVLESMFHCGELVIHHRDGARKYYGLAEKLLPHSILKKPDPNRTLADFNDWYVKRRIGAIGLLWNKSGDAWLGSHLKKEARAQAIKRLLEKDALAEIQIAGMDEMFYALKTAVPILEDKTKHSAAAVLAPLDNLMWDRKLIAQIFGFDYKWEVYTPAKQRKYGYYVLPLIYNEKFIGRFEPGMDRKSKTLHIHNWWWEKNIKAGPGMIDALTGCFKAFARFLNAHQITVTNPLLKNKLKWMNECV